jgi:hypothetical protein
MAATIARHARLDAILLRMWGLMLARFVMEIRLEIRAPEAEAHTAMHVVRVMRLILPKHNVSIFPGWPLGMSVILLGYSPQL